MIPPAIERQFSAAIRERGQRYFAQGRVAVEAFGREIRATVDGTETYEVVIRPGVRTPGMSCTCPYAFEHSQCKHMWATLVAADAQGLLMDATQNAAQAVNGNPASRSSVSGKPVQREPAWRRRLNALRSEVPRPPRAAQREWPANRRIFYELDLDETAGSGKLTIDIVARFVHGGERDGDRFEFGGEVWLRAPDPADRTIAHMLLGANPLGYLNRQSPNRLRFVIPPLLYDSALRAICETGRFTIRTRASDATEPPPPIHCDIDRPWTFVARLVRTDDGGSRVEGVLRRDDAEIPLDAPRIITMDGTMILPDTIALFDYEVPWGLLTLLRDGAIEAAPDEVHDLALELRVLPGSPEIELPPDVTIDEAWPTPVPQLRVEPKRLNYSYRDTLVLDLSFNYDGVNVRPAKRSRVLVNRDAKRIVHRNIEFESAARARLEQLGAREVNDWSSSKERLAIAPSRLNEMVLMLIAEGWEVWANGKQYRSASRTEVTVSSGIDWFDLEGGLTFGNQHVPLPRLLAVARKRDTTIVLDDGSFGVLPQTWLERYAPVIAAGTEHGDAVRFTRAQTLLLDALLAGMDAPNIDDTFRRIRDELRDFSTIEAADPPPTFRGELRPYQREGLGWMHFLRRFNLGGCLADDMGLGKTVQVLALLEERRVAGAGPSLVVVPKSLVFNWHAEAARFAPDLRVRDYTGASRRNEPLDTNAFDLLITTYGTLRRDAPDLKDIEFEYVILDEAQAIKNANTASAKAARLLRSRQRLAMSGTPIENRIDELWSLFEFLNPGMLGAASVFSVLKYAGTGVRGKGVGDDDVSGNSDGGDDISGNSDGGGDVRGDSARANTTLLARALRPFLLRRTKEQVAPELPTRTEQTVFVELEPAERKLYDELREHYRAALLARVDAIGMKRAKIEILEALLRLRQAACHPALIDKKRSTKSSSKLDVLLDQLKEVIAEGHRALVFSQFTSFLALVRTRLEKEAIPHEYLDGRTRDRQARVERFQADASCPVFLISLKAGGYGLNLTAADYVFILDPWWNPAVEAQAIDRTHRIGQDRHVMALRLIARDTVEEKVLQLQQQKRELADAILAADAGGLAGIGREELALLLG